MLSLTGVCDESFIIGVNNLGSGSKVGASVINRTLNLRSLVGTSGEINISQTSDEITFNLPNIITGSTTAYPTSITYDNKGRITASSAGSQPITALNNLGSGSQIGSISSGTLNLRSLIGASGHINTTQNINDITFSLPNVGIAGTTAYPRSITTDAQGRITSTISENRLSFNVIKGAIANIPHNFAVTIGNWIATGTFTYNDVGSNFDSVGGIFTVPVSGRYSFSFCVTWETNSNGRRYVTLVKNGASNGFLVVQTGNSISNVSNTGTVQLNLVAGDNVRLVAYQDSGISIQIITSLSTSPCTWFCGNFLYTLPN